PGRPAPQENQRGHQSRRCGPPPRPLRHTRQQPIHRRRRRQASRHLERRCRGRGQTQLPRRHPPPGPHPPKPALTREIRRPQLGPHLPRGPRPHQLPPEPQAPRLGHSRPHPTPRHRGCGKGRRGRLPRRTLATQAGSPI
ncbi:uncharacterized protein METZ01_LOCUS419343, partial [marine metagenome]